MSTVPVKKIVNVTVQVAALAPAAPVFSIGLCVGSSSRLPTYDRLREYGSLLDVAGDFQASDEEYKLASEYFGQSPTPDTLMIGRRLLAASSGTLKSGLRSTTLTDYTAVTAGGFDISVDGTLRQVHGIDLSSGVTDMDGVATHVQTALRAATGALETVTYDTGTASFVITSVTTGATSVVNYAVPPTTALATDLGIIMGLTAAKGATRTVGAAIETVTDSLNALARLSGAWYGFHVTKELTDDELVAASAWAESNTRFHFATTASPVAYDGSSAADLGARLKALSYTHSLVQFSSTTDYACASAMARGLAVKYDQINSTITLEFKQEPGVVPENLTTSQYSALEAKNYCYLATVANGFVMLFNTKTPSGRFFDEIVNIDWFTQDLQNNVFTAVATSPTKVPQTDKGMEVLLQAASKTCEKAVRNRMAASGVWTHDGFGALETGDLLQQGYYLYAIPVAEQSDADRAARKTPPIQGALIGAGAFHSVDITFNFQR